MLNNHLQYALNTRPFLQIHTANSSGGVKTLLAIFFLILLGGGIPTVPVNAQTILASYPFTNESPEASVTGLGLTAGDVEISSGSLVYGTSHATSWSGDSGVPYVQGNSGWNALTALGGKYFSLKITRETAASIQLSTLRFYYRRTGSGPEHLTISLNGVLIDSLMNTPADQTTLAEIQVNQSSLDSLDIKFIGWGGGLGQLRLDDIELSGTVSMGTDPLTGISEESLFGLNYVEGQGPSAGRKVKITGLNLTPESGLLSLSGDHEFSFSADSLSYSSSLLLPYTGGTLEEEIYIRLNDGLQSGDYLNRTSILSGGGADPVTVTLSGTVFPSFSYPYENEFRSVTAYQLALDQGFTATASDVRETSDPYLKMDLGQYIQTPVRDFRSLDYLQARVDVQQYGGSLEQKIAALISVDGGATFDTLRTFQVPDEFTTLRTDIDLTSTYNAQEGILRFQMVSGGGSIRFRDLKIWLQYRTEPLPRTAGYRMLSAPVDGARLSHLLKENGVFTQCFLEADRVGDACNNAENTENVFFFNTANNIWQPAIHIDQELEKGTGVLVYFFDTMPDGINPGFPEELRMSGYEPDSDVTPAVNQQAGGFTLLGNPFGTAIRFDDLISFDVRNQVYVYDHAYSGNIAEGDLDGGDSGGGWRIYNGSVGSLTNGVIAPFQGFFIVNHDTVESPNIRFPLSAKTEGGTLYTRQQAVKTPSMPIHHTNGHHANGHQTNGHRTNGHHTHGTIMTPSGTASSASVHAYLQLTAIFEDALVSDMWFTFADDGSVDKHEQDMTLLEPLEITPHIQLSTPVQNEKMSVKHLPSDALPLNIPISVESWVQNADSSLDGDHYQAAEGDARLLWPDMHQLPEIWEIYLHDLQEGESINLRSQSEYTFTLNSHASDVASKRYQSGVHRSARSTKELPRFQLTITEQPTGSEQEQESAYHFRLYPNYPNPFNPVTNVSFEIPSASSVSVEVFDVTGRKVLSEPTSDFSAGRHQITLNAGSLATGLYIYQIRTAFGIRTGSFSLMK